MTRRRITGRNAFLQLLIDEGVTHLFGNPGTTELAIMEAVPDFPQLKYVLGLQESIVVGMADGYARASGRLAACNLHCTPGLGHAMGALYNAKFAGSPLIVTAGQYEQGYGCRSPCSTSRWCRSRSRSSNGRSRCRGSKTCRASCTAPRKLHSRRRPDRCF